MSHDGYEISTDDARLDRTLIRRFLHDDYLGPRHPAGDHEPAIDDSLCFGMYDSDNRQVGFARAITDRAAIAYLADVFVLEAKSGRGLGKWLMRTVLAHPDLQGLRLILLGTADAHSLYERFGFRLLANPGRMMEIAVPYEKRPRTVWVGRPPCRAFIAKRSRWSTAPGRWATCWRFLSILEDALWRVESAGLDGAVEQRGPGPVLSAAWAAARSAPTSQSAPGDRLTRR